MNHAKRLAIVTSVISGLNNFNYNKLWWPQNYFPTVVTYSARMCHRKCVMTSGWPITALHFIEVKNASKNPNFILIKILNSGKVKISIEITNNLKTIKIIFYGYFLNLWFFGLIKGPLSNFSHFSGWSWKIVLGISWGIRLNFLTSSDIEDNNQVWSG